MDFRKAGDRRYVRFPRLGRISGFQHAYSTRPQDVSARLDDRQAERAARRAVMAEDLGFDSAQIFHTIQIHETQIAHITAASAPGAYDGVDALISDRPGAALMTFSADCPLLLVVDPVHGALGMVHASWRCTVARAAEQLITAMRAAFSSAPEELMVGVGPSAGPEMYEVKDDVWQAAANLPDRDQLFPRHDGRMYFDLWTANKLALERSGVRPENIEIAGLCTLTRNDLFYSFRREGPGCGHFGLMAGWLV